MRLACAPHPILRCAKGEEEGPPKASRQASGPPASGGAALRFCDADDALSRLRGLPR